MAATYLTAAEVASRWGCSRNYVRGLGRRGEMVGMRLGSDWRFSLAVVEAYEAANTTPTPEPRGPKRSEPASRPTSAAPALPDGPYLPVFKGAVPWRSEVIEAAPPAARRSGSARTKKPASVRT